MGAPGEMWQGVKNMTRRASLELMSAMSSLNMYPELNPGFSVESYDPNFADQYISVIDANVSHAMDHLMKVSDYLDEAQNQATWVMEVSYNGNAKEMERRVGELFCVEYFHGTHEAALGQFVVWLVQKRHVWSSIADPSEMRAYDYENSFERAKVWLEYFGYGVTVRCPQQEQER